MRSARAYWNVRILLCFAFAILFVVRRLRQARLISAPTALKAVAWTDRLTDQARRIRQRIHLRAAWADARRHRFDDRNSM
jgi:hypothetical protein